MDGSFRDSPSHIPASSTKHHHPYFTPAEVDMLSDKQRGKLSMSQEDKARQQACAFIEAVGARIGFPRKTIATAQNLYHRFHLFFPRKDFNWHDVTLAALYVSSKMHDTLKKPREILMVSYSIRFPEQAAKSKSIAGEIDMDPAVVEQDRGRLLAVERLILETVCFNFTSRMPFPYVIKIARALKTSKKLSKLAWRLTIDSQRTLVALQFPPHVVALACIYLAAQLSTFERPADPAEPGAASDADIAGALQKRGAWERRFQAQIEDLEAIAHALLDLLIAAAQNPAASTSPSTPSSPSPYARAQAQAQQPPPPPPAPWKADVLVRLKIALRETEHAPRERVPLGGAGDENVLGRNEGTVRFLFGPRAAV